MLGLLGLAVFAVSIAYNFVHACATQDVVAGRPLRAAFADSALYIMGVGTLALFVYVGPWIAFPELAGGFLGTYAGARRAARRSTTYGAARPSPGRV